MVPNRGRWLRSRKAGRTDEEGSLVRNSADKRKRLRRYLNKNYATFITFKKHPEKGQTTAYYKRLRGEKMTEALDKIMGIFDAKD